MTEQPGQGTEALDALKQRYETGDPSVSITKITLEAYSALVKRYEANGVKLPQNATAMRNSEEQRFGVEVLSDNYQNWYSLLRQSINNGMLIGTNSVFEKLVGLPGQYRKQYLAQVKTYFKREELMSEGSNSDYLNLDHALRNLFILNAVNDERLERANRFGAGSFPGITQEQVDSFWQVEERLLVVSQLLRASTMEELAKYYGLELTTQKAELTQWYHIWHTLISAKWQGDNASVHCGLIQSCKKSSTTADDAEKQLTDQMAAYPDMFPPFARNHFQITDELIAFKIQDKYEECNDKAACAVYPGDMILHGSTRYIVKKYQEDYKTRQITLELQDVATNTLTTLSLQAGGICTVLDPVGYKKVKTLTEDKLQQAGKIDLPPFTEDSSPTFMDSMFREYVSTIGDLNSALTNCDAFLRHVNWDTSHAASLFKSFISKYKAVFTHESGLYYNLSPDQLRYLMQQIQVEYHTYFFYIEDMAKKLYITTTVPGEMGRDNFASLITVMMENFTAIDEKIRSFFDQYRPQQT